MTRSISLLATMAFIACLLYSASAQANGNCHAKLVGKAYDCKLKISPNGQNDTACIDFFTGGKSADFDLMLDIFDYGCACDVIGSFNSPSFDASSSAFECAEPKQESSFAGKVKGMKLSGQEEFTTGEQILFSCTQRSSPCP